MHNLYLLAACFLPLITFRSTPNNFQVGANLTSQVPSPVDQPLPELQYHDGPSNEIIPYIEYPPTALGKVTGNCAAMVIAYRLAVTNINCVLVGPRAANNYQAQPIPDTFFTYFFKPGSVVETKVTRITRLYPVNSWLSDSRPYNSIAVIQVEGLPEHTPHHMQMRACHLKRGDEVDVLGFDDENTMYRSPASIVFAEPKSKKYILQTKDTSPINSGSPVIKYVKVEDNNHALYCGLISGRLRNGQHNFAPFTLAKINEYLKNRIIPPQGYGRKK